MKISFAVDSLAALAQETRLNIFRLLVRHAPTGLPAGTIARRLRLPGPTLSFHLNVLAAADLVQPHKNGRSIAYSANLDSVNRLTGISDGSSILMRLNDPSLIPQTSTVSIA